MEQLLEKYLVEEAKVATINGLLMAQAACSRKLQEVYSKDVLDIMQVISAMVEDIKNK